MSSLRYADELFAPLDRDHDLERIGGGNETEVYRTDDQRFVVKVKGDLGGDCASALRWAKLLRTAAESYVVCLGPTYSIPSYFLVARSSDGKAHPVVVQPYVTGGHPLHDTDYSVLSAEERANVAAQLNDILRRSLLYFRHTGSMPDLYGRVSTSRDERLRLNTLRMLPHRIWSFLVTRNLLRSHNLLLAHGKQQRVVLVDYDPVRQGKLYRQTYYAVRWFLILRDQLLILLMRLGYWR